MTTNCVDKKCPINKICNPKTNRCVLRTGKIGKKLVKRVPKRKSTKRKSTKRKSTKRKSTKRKSTKRKSKLKQKNRNSKNGKKLSTCMVKNKKIFEPKYDIKINLDFNDEDKIKVVDKRTKKIVQTYKKIKTIYDNFPVQVTMYGNGKNRVVLKKETTDSDVPSEFVIYKTLKKYDCGLIRLRHVYTGKMVNNDYTHFYIMDAFDGDIEDISGMDKDQKKLSGFDPLVLGRELKKQLTCLYNKINPPLWYTDLKDANVFYCSDDKQKGLPGKIYLGDLGSMAKIDGEYIATYPPPEVRHGKGFFTIKNKDHGKKIISWVTGITLLQTVIGRTFQLGYYNISNKTVKQIKTIVSDYLEKVEDIKIKKILLNLLEVDPENRKTLEEIKF